MAKPEHLRPSPRGNGDEAAVKALPGWIWSPLAVAILALVPGVLGWWFAQPWLFPSLAPTAALQASHPQLPSSRPYPVVFGHTVAILMGYAAVWALGAAGTPSIFHAGRMIEPRLWASVVGVAMTELVQFILRAQHPPAASTVLLITLGGFKMRWSDLVALIVGVAVVAVVGEVLRRARLVQLQEQR